MKIPNPSFTLLCLLLLIVALVFCSGHIHRQQSFITPTPWLAPQLTPGTAPTSGWWDRLPTPFPLPTLTPKK